MKILTWPNEKLTRRCKYVKLLEGIDEVRRQAYEMYPIMLDADGVALAAPQVGINKRFFVVKCGLMAHRIIVNPKWKPAKGAKKIAMEEGCLSFPGITLSVKRYSHILFDYCDGDGRIWSGELKDFAAQVFQHETDHLDGKVFTKI